MPARSQASQGPEQALSQQTPSEHSPPRQSVVAVHELPNIRLALHSPASQNASGWHWLLDTQLVSQPPSAPPHRYAPQPASRSDGPLGVQVPGEAALHD